MRYLIPLFCFIFFSSSVFAQDAEKIPKRISQYVKEAEDALLRFDDAEAERLYKIALEKKPNYSPAVRGLAVAYDLQGKFEESAKLLEQVIEKNANFSRVIYFDCAVAHYRYGNYQKAIEYFNRYQEIIKMPVVDFGFNGRKELAVEFDYTQKVEGNIYACEIAKDSIFNKNVSAIYNLGLPVNSSSNEYFPFLSNNQEVLFFTRQFNRHTDENLFYSTKENEQWMNGTSIDSVFNTPVNEGMATFTRDGRQMFYTACQRPDVAGTCDIRKVLIEQNKIMEYENLAGLINSEKWESQACINCDGSALYFASNRPDGLGRTDLYVSYRQADNSWGKAKNLGATINTKGYEESPFITDDGQTLFFSSTGHLGMGEQDLFMSRRDSLGNWGPAINLGPPINTAYRELGFFLSADGITGYFSSNRPGGKGKMDIYKFDLSRELSAEFITYVEGFVKDSITHEPVQTILYPLGQRPVPTDKNGRFFLCLKAGEDFDFEIREKEYHPYHSVRPIPQWDNKTLYQLDILLQPYPEPLPLETVDVPENDLRNIFFEFDQFDLADSSRLQLEQIVAKIQAHKIKSIEIIGYCDYYGSEEYNFKLSQKRAEIVANFLKQKGILTAEIKINIKGKGELNNEAERAFNRRVEINIQY